MKETIPVSDKIKNAFQTLRTEKRVQEALDFIVPDQKKRLDEQIEIAKIPGFSYHEEKRAARMREFFAQYGLTDITTDRFGNVYGIRRGTGNGPRILIDAHTDSVFPLYTKLEPRFEGSRVWMPGITDDASGLSAMLSVLRALNEKEIRTVGDIWFAGIVEEEPGIFGMHKFISENTFDAVISLDCAGFGWMAVGCGGECRFEVRFRSEGERINYGRYSQCLTAAARAAVKVSEYTPREKTMVLADAIADDPHKGQGCTTDLTRLTVQVRACRQAELDLTEQDLKEIMAEACREENERCGAEKVTFDMHKDEFLSPAAQNWNNPVCGSMYHIYKEMGVEEPRFFDTGNANGGAAIRAGIQAVIIGTGGEHGGIHSLQEHFDTTDMHKGPQAILLQALMMAGMDGVIDPQA